LQGAIPLVKALLAAGFQPIVFCRFVDTAEYVAAQLPQTGSVILSCRWIRRIIRVKKSIRN
jgi:hypothetical protein